MSKDAYIETGVYVDHESIKHSQDAINRITKSVDTTLSRFDELGIRIQVAHKKYRQMLKDANVRFRTVLQSQEKTSDSMEKVGATAEKAFDAASQMAKRFGTDLKRVRAEGDRLAKKLEDAFGDKNFKLASQIAKELQAVDAYKRKLLGVPEPKYKPASQADLEYAKEINRLLEKNEKKMGDIGKQTKKNTRDMGFYNSAFVKFGVTMSGIAATLFVFQEVKQWIMALFAPTLKLQETMANFKFETKLAGEELKRVKDTITKINATGLMDTQTSLSEYQAYIDKGIAAVDATVLLTEKVKDLRKAYDGTLAGEIKEFKGIIQTWTTQMLDDKDNIFYKIFKALNENLKDSLDLDGYDKRIDQLKKKLDLLKIPDDPLIGDDQAGWKTDADAYAQQGKLQAIENLEREIRILQQIKELGDIADTEVQRDTALRAADAESTLERVRAADKILKQYEERKKRFDASFTPTPEFDTAMYDLQQYYNLVLEATKLTGGATSVVQQQFDKEAEKLRAQYKQYKNITEELYYEYYTIEKLADAWDMISEEMKLQLNEVLQNYNERQEFWMLFSQKLNAEEKKRLNQQNAPSITTQQLQHFEKIMKEYDRKHGSFVAGLKEQIQTLPEHWGNAFEQGMGFMQNALNSMGTALTNFVTQGKVDFKSLADSIISDIIRMNYQILMSKFLTHLFGDGGGSAGMFSQAGGVTTESVSPTMPRTAAVPMATATPSKANNVQVNVINNGKEPVTATSKQTFNGKQMVIDVVLDAVNRNVSNMRDAIKAVR